MSADKSVKTVKRTQTNPKSLANLRPWQPGQSPNPGGRPKSLIADGLRERLSDPVELNAYIDGIFKKAKKGDVGAFTAIRDTTEGKPAQGHEVSGRDGGPIIFQLERIAKD